MIFTPSSIQVDKLDAELATRNNVISEYKTITSQLSDKLEKAQKGSVMVIKEDGDNVDKRNADLAQRVRELELELAQTKLALVETECKNQDLTHQFTTALQQQQQMEGGGGNSGSGRSTWLSKTLSSIKETATAHAPTVASAASAAASSAAAVAAGRAGGGGHSRSEALKKSTSVDAIQREIK